MVINVGPGSRIPYGDGSTNGDSSPQDLRQEDLRGPGRQAPAHGLIRRFLRLTLRAGSEMPPTVPFCFPAKRCKGAIAPLHPLEVDTVR